MHFIDFNREKLVQLQSLNCWPIELGNLEIVAMMVLGSRPGGHIRSGTQRAIIANSKFGSAADSLAAEFRRLATQVDKIRRDGLPAADVRAAAFFHLRFVHIHPLLDGNGRVGRLLLALQCAQITSGCGVVEFLVELEALAEEYKQVFTGASSSEMFEFMVHLIARILAVYIPEEMALPFPLEPTYPERDTRPASSMRGFHSGPTKRSKYF